MKLLKKSKDQKGFKEILSFSAWRTLNFGGQLFKAGTYVQILFLWGKTIKMSKRGLFNLARLTASRSKLLTKSRGNLSLEIFKYY